MGRSVGTAEVVGLGVGTAEVVGLEVVGLGFGTAVVGAGVSDAAPVQKKKLNAMYAIIGRISQWIA